MLNQNTYNQMTEHAKAANDYKELCKVSDELSKVSDVKNTNYNFNGWTPIENDYNPSSQFKAVAYQKGNNVVICYVGTNFKSLKDIAADIKMVFKPTVQMKEANVFYGKIRDQLPLHVKVILAGHSEGGSEAQYVCAQREGVPTFTYNAFMTGALYSKKDREQAAPYIVNYRNRNDIVSKLGVDIGYQMITPDATMGKLYSTVDSMKLRKHHRIENMGDCNLAIPLSKYKQIEPQFVDKIDDNIIIRHEDIKDFTAEELDLLETELCKRNAEGTLLYDHEAKALAAQGRLIHVKAYTRDDGTRVKEHYRKAPVYAS